MSRDWKASFETCWLDKGRAEERLWTPERRSQLDHLGVTSDFYGHDELAGDSMRPEPEARARSHLRTWRPESLR